MAEVTVSQLADVVKTPVDRLLKQMKQAGLSHTEAEQVVSDEDKQTLLTFLKSSHGESTDAPKKITLKRKSQSELKLSGAQGRSRTVNALTCASYEVLRLEWNAACPFAVRKRARVVVPV